MITLHGIFGSPFVRAVRIALEEKGLDWKWSPFKLGEQKQEPYLSLHPFGKIPALTDDGFALYETQAMLRYINNATPEPMLIPADRRDAARMDQLLAILDCYAWLNVARPIGFNRIIAPRIGMTPDEQAVSEAVPHAHTTLAAIEALMPETGFMVGPALSLADIALIPHLDWLQMTPECAPIFAGHKKLTAWLAAMRGRQSVRNSAVAPERLLAA
jgi:glutathione S-transferase